MSIKLGRICTLGMTGLLCVVQMATAQSGKLVEAVRQRDTQTVRALLKASVDVNEPQADGATALHWAAHWDDLAVAELLIGAGANVNAANDYGVTPLSLACTNANAGMVERLLKAGANPNAPSASGETPLMTCARTGNAEAVKSLLGRGADPKVAEPESGQTALMWAAAQGHAQAVAALLEVGADVNQRSKSGFLPLLFAARSGDVDTSRLLLAKGAKVNDGVPVKNAPGSPASIAEGRVTALLIAAASGHEKLGLFLLDNGADPNAWDGGAAPLHYAMLQGFSNSIPRANYVAYLFRPNLRELAKALLAHGADPNVRFVRLNVGNGFRAAVGATPFYLATSTEDTELMRALVAKGADPNLTTNAKVTPLMAVAGINRGNSRPEDALNGFRDALEAAKLAIEFGNDIHSVDNRGQTALHGAAYTGSDPIVQFLIERGADVNARDKTGETPWTLAMSLSNDGEIVHEITANLLLKLGAKRLTLGDLARK